MATVAGNSTLADSANSAAPLIKYSITDAGIAQLKQALTGLTANTTAEYKAVVAGIADCRELRVAVEKRRKELKEDSLAWGRKVDGEAKRLTAALLDIEVPLKLAKQAVDDEKSRAKREKEDAERAKIEAELKDKREAEEAAAKVERERLAAEQAAESERLAEERRKFEEERAAAEAKLAEERAAIDTEQQRLERERLERQSRREAMAEQARLDALKPDAFKLANFVVSLRAIVEPELTTDDANQVLNDAMQAIDEAANKIEQYCQSVCEQ